jgi:UDP-3-O-[3-hydroxymyristoyl] glucosamine N-acyltransferase
MLNTGLTLVGQRAQIAPGAAIGRNVVIRPRVTDLGGATVPSGKVVGR